jgi:multicomponent Na+:H+ antiporter subunit B
MNSDRLRFLLFVPAAFVLGIFVVRAAAGLPGFGRYPGPYGDLINQRGVPERHVTNMVTAVNFDYRGLDTLGEEFILFAAVTGVILLLRDQPEENVDEKGTVPGRKWHAVGNAVRFVSLGLVGTLVLFGLYIVLHAQLTPGGGFQGGAITGTASLLIYVSYEHQVYQRTINKTVFDVIEAAGAGGYALIGIACMIMGGAFLQNVLPLGETGTLLSGGTIPLINLAVGLEVTAGFILLFLEFTKEILLHPAQKPRPDRPDASGS